MARKPVERVDPTILVTANGTSGEAGRSGLTRGCDQTRTLMRHARPTSALPIGLLALAVLVLACRGGLVSAARCPQLLLPHSLPATLAAIALAAITARTDSEQRVALGVEASPHAKALGRSICCHRASHSQLQYARDDRTDDWRLRRDDVAGLRLKFRKLRFQMIANRLRLGINSSISKSAYTPIPTLNGNPSQLLFYPVVIPLHPATRRAHTIPTYRTYKTGHYRTLQDITGQRSSL